MERIDTIEETYGFYAQMGGVRHALPHGIEYRFPATTPHRRPQRTGTAWHGGCQPPLDKVGARKSLRDVIRLLGDLSSFVYSEVDFTAPADHLSRTRFSGKYLGISLNTDGAIQTYSARNDTRILNEGLHAFVSISSIPSFMRIAKGTHLRYVGISLFEPFFETHGLRTPPGFWEAANHVLNATATRSAPRGDDLPPHAQLPAAGNRLPRFPARAVHCRCRTGRGLRRLPCRASRAPPFRCRAGIARAGQGDHQAGAGPSPHRGRARPARGPQPQQAAGGVPRNPKASRCPSTCAGSAWTARWFCSTKPTFPWPPYPSAWATKARRTSTAPSAAPTVCRPPKRAPLSAAV